MNKFWVVNKATGAKLWYNFFLTRCKCSYLLANSNDWNVNHQSLLSLISISLIKCVWHKKYKDQSRNINYQYQGEHWKLHHRNTEMIHLQLGSHSDLHADLICLSNINKNTECIKQNEHHQTFPSLRLT